MRHGFFLGMAVLVVMTMPLATYAGDSGPNWTAKILKGVFYSQTAYLEVEVFKSGVDTFHYLTNGRRVWELPDDFGWTGRGTVSLSGLTPEAPDSFWVEGKIAQDGEFIASPAWRDTTLPQICWGDKKQRTQRRDIHLHPGEWLIIGRIHKPDTVIFRSLILFGHSDSAKLALTISDSAYAHYGMGRVYWQGNLAGYNNGPWEIPVDLDQLNPFPGMVNEPDFVWLLIYNPGPSNLIIWTARGGLPVKIKPVGGWWRPAVDPDSTGALFAIGYERKQETAVSSRPATKPDGFGLSQNYPNPFNPTTSFSYSVPVSNNVTIDIYNELGTKVRSLVNRFAAAGTYTATWDGKDDNGNSLASGIYFYKMQSSHFNAVKKMLLVR